MSASDINYFYIAAVSVVAFVGAHSCQYFLLSEFEKHKTKIDAITALLMLATCVPCLFAWAKLALIPIVAYILGGWLGLYRFNRLQETITHNEQLRELQSRFQLAFKLNSERATVAISEFPAKVMEPFIKYCENEGLYIITEHHHRTGKVLLHVSR